MSIQTALRSLPSKPVLFIAPAIIVAVLGWHYSDIYRICSHRADLMTSLDNALSTARDEGSSFVFENVFPSDWDTVRVFQNYKPDTKSFHCPFGWHLSEDERDSMARRGDLTVIAFYKDKSLIDFADYPSAKAKFSISDEPVRREGVAFDVKQADGNPGYLISPRQ